MKLDLTIQELEIIFDSLPNIREFEIYKEFELRDNNIKLDEKEFKAYMDSYKELRNKVLKAISEKH